MTPLRLDDIGASSKHYERHRGKWWPYRELTAPEIDTLARWLCHRDFSMTLAITACWVEEDGALNPFHKKYHDLAGAIHYWTSRGVFEIACHGLTHCVPGRHRPSWIPWRSNRQWHREFIDAVPMSVQREHLKLAKAMLEDRFCTPVTTLVPPGNAISEQLAMTAVEQEGFDVVTCRARGRNFIVDDATHAVLHDRDIVARGRGVLDALPPGPYTTVKAWRASKLGRLPHV